MSLHKFIRIFIATFMLVSLFSAYFLIFNTNPRTLSRIVKDNEDEKEEKAYMLKDLYKEEFKKAVDPQLGYVPRERLVQARQIMKEKKAVKALRKSALSNAQWTERGPNNVGGRTRALMWDPITTNKVWAGGVTGGLWYNTDITSGATSWQKVDDFWDDIAISCIAYDPNNTQTFYVGTGEGWFTGSGRGEGIFKSTDGGATWQQLSNTTAFYFVNDLVVRDESGTSVIYAGVDGTYYEGAFHNPYQTGLWRSADGGISWEQVLPTALPNNQPFAPADIEIAADNRIWIGVKSNPWGDGGGSILYSDAGTSGTWTVDSTTFKTNTTGRVELACAPSNSNVVYAIIEANSSVDTIAYTNNKGSSWSGRNKPVSAVSYSPDFSNGQAWYDLIAQVDPNSANTVIIGTIDLYKSTNTGTNWTEISAAYENSTNNLPYVHADQHQIQFNSGSSSEIVFGCDGGVYYSNDGGSSFSERNNGYNVTQFYGLAMYPDAASNYFLAGSQDNGTQQFSSSGLGSTVEATGGDGAFCNIDQNEPTYQYTQYVYTNFYRSTDGGTNFSYLGFGNYGHFINPSDFDDAANILYAATINQNYLRWNNAHTTTVASNVTVTSMASDEMLSAVTVSPNTSNRIFIGTETGKLILVDGANTGPSKTGTVLNSGAGMPTAWINCIAVENGDDNHLLAVFSNYGVQSIWETLDGGTNWTSCEGDLPDMPVRWAIFNPNNSSQAMIATELGVWSTDELNGSSTLWEPANSGQSNVRCDMLQTRPSDNLVAVATHGRGLFTSDVFASVTAGFSANTTIAYVNEPISFYDGSIKATSWSWNFGDGNNSTLQYPSHSYSQPGYYSVTLSINSGADSDTKTNYIHVMPSLGTPLTPADGGDFETNAIYFDSKADKGFINVWERGTPGNYLTTVNSGTNVWKTILSDDVTLGTYTSSLYTPSFNFTASGNYSVNFRKSMEVYGANAPFGVYMEYTIDNGQTWTRLGDDNDGYGTNWYDRGPNSAISHSVTPGGYAWSGNYDNQATSYDCSFLAGNSSVAFRFVFMIEKGWTAGYNEDGFMIDDFEIQGEINDTSLPVELTSFTASQIGSTVELSWETESELENAFWVVEKRTTDGDYATIAKLNGRGTTSEHTKYHFSDKQVSSGNSYTYRLSSVSLAGKTERHSEVQVAVTLPEEFNLAQNYPNPFNATTKINYQLAKNRRVNLLIYDSLGRLVKTLIDKDQAAGTYSVNFDASALASGVYYFALRAGNFFSTRKMLLVK